MMRPALSSLTNMQQRIITGTIGIGFVIVALWFSEWGYLALFGALTIACQLEFYRLLFQDGNAPLRFYGTLVGSSLFVTSFFIERGDLAPKWYVLVFPALAMVYFIKLYKVEQKPFTNIGFTFLGIAYTALPFVLLNKIVFTNGFYQFQVIMGILILLWASDSGAYFAGKSFGKTKLFERVSPKKTWEGSIGGAIAASIGCAILIAFFQDFVAWQWIGIAIIIVVAGTYGDLVESLFKRSILIKDSGNVLPGHGGFLDRFDGLLLSLPFIAAWLALGS